MIIFIKFLDTSEMVGCDDCTLDWNIIIMIRLFFLPPTLFFFILVFAHHHQLYLFTAVCNPRPSFHGFSMNAHRVILGIKCSSLRYALICFGLCYKLLKAHNAFSLSTINDPTPSCLLLVLFFIACVINWL